MRFCRAARGRNRSPAGESTPELAADARQMREEIKSIKSMWAKLESSVSEGNEPAQEDADKERAAEAGAPDADNYW